MTVDVEEGARILEQGGVVAYPTETVYGLGADATLEAPIRRLLGLKGRDPDRGISILVTGLDACLRWAPDLPSVARRLAERFWPGPLTLVVPVPAATLAAVASRKGVGFRCSAHPTAASLARAFGRPIACTSCNRSGEEPCRRAEEVTARFGATLAVVGGEPAGGAPPSTVIAISETGGLELVREGSTPFRDILAEADR